MPGEPHGIRVQMASPGGMRTITEAGAQHSLCEHAQLGRVEGYRGGTGVVGAESHVVDAEQVDGVAQRRHHRLRTRMAC